MASQFRKFKAVVFDLDGVLIDSEPIFVEAARRLLARRGREIDAAFMHSMMGMPGRVVLPLFREHFQLTEDVEQLTNEYRDNFLQIINVEPMQIMPGVAELLDAIEARRLPKAIATSSRRQYVDHVVAPLGFLGRFVHILTCDDVTHGKPEPEIYELAARRLEISPAEMLVLEDSPNGVQAAKAAGAFCVAVPHARTPHETVAMADLIVASMREIKLLELLGEECL